MARVNVPVIRISRHAVNALMNGDEVAGADLDGMRMVNDGATVLFVDNLSGFDETISLIVVETVDFSPAAPVVLTVPDQTYAALIGPFPQKYYGNVLEFDVTSASLNFSAFSLL